MSARLANSHLDRIERHARNRPYIVPSAEDVTDMVEEIQERRAADLSETDLDVLHDIRSRINANYDSTLDYINDVQLALLDRLLSRGKDGR